MKNERLREELEIEDPEEAGGGESLMFLYSVTSQTPWWIVSVLMHALLIALSALISMAIEMPDSEPVITTTKFFNEPPREAPKLAQIDRTAKVLDSKLPDDGRVVDADGQEKIVVPDNMEAEIGERFTTINENYEEVGAHGNPLAQVFYDIHGKMGDPGGGGNWGTKLSDDMMGLNGSASMGDGGGLYGGHGIGKGPDYGPGDATCGTPKGGYIKFIVRKYNPTGSLQPILPVDKALHWLAYHQEPDGHWDCKKYGAQNKNDTAATALALLTFVGFGHSEKVGAYKDNVRRAVAWLRSKQDANGLIWDHTDDGATHRAVGYPNAIATLALAETAGMGGLPETKATAQRAVDYSTSIHQFGEGSDRMGWRYGPKAEGDLSVTGWYIMALKSAKVSGLHVDGAAFEGAVRFLQSVEIKEAGSDPAYPLIRYKYRASDEHAQTAHRLAAIGTLSRLFLGWKREELQPSVEWFVAKGGVPNWGANGESVDLYYWYYGSMACFQENKMSIFKVWNEAMKTALIPHQRQKGDEDGSWDPVGDYSGEWGRVGQTALSALCLEVYYRHELLR